MMKCDICGKTVHYFQHQMSMEDDIVKAIWHVSCAASKEEWYKKITEILAKPIKEERSSRRDLKR